MRIAFFCYFCILSAISFFVKRKKETDQSYALGNRSINYWVTAIATQASDMGSWLFLAFPAAIYTNGLFEFWTAIGLIIFMFLNWVFIAAPLRNDTEKYNAVTVTEYFSKKYHDHSGYIGIIGGFLTLLFFTFYTASGLVGMGRLFESAFGLNYHTGICLGLLTVALYTLIGGFIAVAWCDFFQGVFLLAVIVIVPIYAYFYIGGLQPILASATANAISLSLFPENKNLVHALFLASSWGLGYFGQPHILINFMGIDDVHKTKQATYIGMTWQIIVLTAAACIGIVGLGFYPNDIANTELLFVDITQALFVPFFTGLALCAILAATLSSMDSHILVSGATCAQDILPFFVKKQSHNHLLWASRAGSLGISLLALAIAWNNTNSVYSLVNYAWSGLGSSFGPLVIISLYFSKHMNTSIALCGIISGAFVSGLLPFFAPTILPLVPGFLTSLCIMLFLKTVIKYR